MKENCTHKELSLTADSLYEHHWYCSSCKKKDFTNAEIGRLLKRSDTGGIMNDMKKIILGLSILITLTLVIPFHSVDAAYVRGYYRSNGTYVQPYIRSSIIKPNIKQQQEAIVNHYETDKISRQKSLDDYTNKVTKELDSKWNNTIKGYYDKIDDTMRNYYDKATSIKIPNRR